MFMRDIITAANSCAPISIHEDLIFQNPVFRPEV